MYTTHGLRRWMVISLGLIVAATAAYAQTWDVVYQTDFASDPGWVTNSPQHYYWESDTQTYRSIQIDGAEDYAYRLVPGLQGGRAWRVEYDIYPVQYSWAGNGRLMLVDSSLRTQLPTTIIVLDFNLADGGYWIDFHGCWGTDCEGEHMGHFNVGMWYRATVEWSPDSAALSAAVRERDTGALVAQSTLFITADFAGIDRVAFSTVADSYAPGATGVARFDNIVVSQAAACDPVPGEVIAWGDNSRGQCDVPELNSDFVAIGAGEWHSVGLKADGSIVPWGDNSTGQLNVPPPNAEFVAIAAGYTHTLGLKADGSIVAWGTCSYGECDVPAPNSGFMAVGGGAYHSLGLKSDGSIRAWGRNTEGQCNVPAPNTDFIAVAAGGRHSLGLRADGSIEAWGWNLYGQCNVPSPNTSFVAMAGGEEHSLGLKADGSIVAWGRNDYGQCTVPPPNAEFVAIAGGGAFNKGFSLGLKSDGSIVGWGYNGNGQLNVPPPNARFRAISAGGFHGLGLWPLLCDMNCDGVVDFNDINPFVLALSDHDAYVAEYPCCDYYNGDCNENGFVDFADINCFVAALSGQ